MPSKHADRLLLLPTMPSVKYPGPATTGAVEPVGQYTVSLPQGAGTAEPGPQYPPAVQTAQSLTLVRLMLCW
jgi:hypothetical protein